VSIIDHPQVLERQVFKRGCFGWEYKGKHANLDRAYQQLLQYRESLHNPPLLVVSDFATIVVHPNFVNRLNQPTTLAAQQRLRPPARADPAAVADGEADGCDSGEGRQGDR
jgi:hypothetical protein